VKPDYGRHYLTSLFEPRSVAVVGATGKPGKIGEVLVSNLLASGYRGRLLGVNPRHAVVHGVPCVPRLSALGGAVDLAVIATPPHTVPALVAECGEAGVRFAVVITAGFGETGAAGAELEAQVLAAARRHGVRIIGPNCLGLLRPSIGLNASFSRGGAAPGGLGLLSQSGAVCTAMLDWARGEGIGFSSVVSLGGTVDVGLGEALDYLAADSATRHVLVYVEGVRDARRFAAGLRMAARHKPVVIMKVGRHPAGSRAAVSHTGAIVGGDDVFEAVVKRCGAVRVDHFEGLLSAARVLRGHAHGAGPRLAIVTNGGGPGVMAADRAADLGLRLPELSAGTVEALQQALPANWSHANPVDLIGDADSARYRAATAACLADPNVDGLIAMLTPQAMTDPLEAAQAVADAASGQTKPVLASWMGGDEMGAARRALRAAGIAEFQAPEAAVDAYGTLVRIGTAHAALLKPPLPRPSREPVNIPAARAIVAGALAAGRTLLDAGEAANLLAAFRIPVVTAIRAATAEEAAAAASALGFPVAMKISAQGITHKSDVGGVRLGLTDAPAVRAAFADMCAAVARARPDAEIRGVDVQPMLGGEGARELLAGIVRDPVFGPAIAFGAGGTAVEVLRDRAVVLPPLDAGMADEMIAATRVSGLLGAFRGRQPANHAAICDVLLRLSDMACEIPEIAELDINPLYAEAKRVVALDARVLLKAAGAPGERLAFPAYPRSLVSLEELPDGARLEVRPIRPEDAAQEQQFVASLSESARRFRFVNALRSLPPDMLERFTHIDYDREMAFIAVDTASGQEAGVARYCPCPDGETCEFAIVIADAWQGRGLGRLLMRKLVDSARAQGWRRLCGHILPDNLRMLDLCRRLGYAVEPIVDGGMRVAVLNLVPMKPV